MWHQIQAQNLVEKNPRNGWCSRTELNRDPLFRKQLLYPIELLEQQNFRKNNYAHLSKQVNQSSIIMAANWASRNAVARCNEMFRHPPPNFFRQTVRRSEFRRAGLETRQNSHASGGLQTPRSQLKKRHFAIGKTFTGFRHRMFGQNHQSEMLLP